MSDWPGRAWFQLGADKGLTLRCWWFTSVAGLDDKDEILLRKYVVIVLPEVFGVNAWVRSVADRLAVEGISALAIPLFARTAPVLELG